MEKQAFFKHIQIAAKNTRELHRKTQSIAFKCMSLFEDFYILTSAQVMDSDHIWVESLHRLCET